MTIRVLLADDQALLRQTFRILISATPDMEVVGEAADGKEAAELARTHHPDVVVMDIRMPGTDGLAATETICGDPELTGTRILILTTFETGEYVASALRAGASGFLGKTASTDDLLARVWPRLDISRVSHELAAVEQGSGAWRFIPVQGFAAAWLTSGGLRARLKTGGAAAGRDRPDLPGQSAACRWCDMRGPW